MQEISIKQEKNWKNYTIKNLAFWVILALIFGVTFGHILYKIDEKPKNILLSTELVHKKINSENENNVLIFHLNKKVEDRTISKLDLKKMQEKSDSDIYKNLFELNNKLSDRIKLTQQIKILQARERSKTITKDEKRLLSHFADRQTSISKEIDTLRKEIKGSFLTPEENDTLNYNLQNDSFTQKLFLLENEQKNNASLLQEIENEQILAKEKFDQVKNVKSYAQLGINKFIALLKLLVGPIIFVTIILGIVGLESLKELGSIGFKAFIYFEIVSTFALAIGIIFANFFGPGRGMNVDPDKLDSSKVQGYIDRADDLDGTSPILEVLKSAIPHDPITPFMYGKTLQVLVMALFLAIVISVFIKNRAKIIKPFEVVQHYLFKLLLIVMWLSPIATFCAMTFLIAEFGINSLVNMGGLLLVMLSACLTFIFGVLGAILIYFKVNIFKFMRYIYKEVLIVFATSSSESALAPLMKKLEDAGISKSVTGLVIPTGYSFNLDCTNIYLSLSVIFLAQAVNVDLSIWHELSIILVLMVTSKGAVGVTGSGFIVLAGTLAALPHTGIPVVVVSILLGIDKFMSEMRAVGNLCGNSVACVVVAIWDKQIDLKKFQYTLNNPDSVKSII